MPAILVNTCDGNLSIAGVPMRTPAWSVLRLTPLWQGPVVRGADRILPGSPGVIPLPRRPNVTVRSLPIVITGDVDQLGVANVDPWVGYEENFDYLRSTVADPTEVGDGTVEAVLTMPSGVTRTADVHVLGLVMADPVAGADGLVARGTLDLSIPTGAFA